MYEFLNRSFYFGHSFAIWFAHYSLWALMPTGLILLAVGKFLFPRRLDAADDQYVRGTDVIAPRKLAREPQGRWNRNWRRQNPTLDRIAAFSIRWLTRLR